MSVTMAPASGYKPIAKPPETTTRSPDSTDLDAWLEEVETLGKLKRITAEAGPDEIR
jgi:hypothetical protein